MDTRIKLLEASGSPYSAEKSRLQLYTSQRPNFISKLISVQNVTDKYVIKREKQKTEKEREEKIYAWSLCTELLVLLPVNQLRYLLNAKEGIEKIPAPIFQKTA